MNIDTRFTLLLNERLAKAVAQESKTTGASRCEVIRRAIAQYLKVKGT